MSFDTPYQSSLSLSRTLEKGPNSVPKAHPLYHVRRRTTTLLITSFHHDAALLRARRRLFRPIIILKIEMGHRRRLLSILWSLARLPDRRFTIRLQSGRPTVRHTKGGGERLCGQTTRRLS